MNVPGYFYTFSASELPEFREIAELSRRSCAVPDGMRVNALIGLPEDDPIVMLRRELDAVPEIGAFTEREIAEKSMEGVPEAILARDRQSGITVDTVTRSQVFPARVELRLFNDLIRVVSDYFGTLCDPRGNYYYPPGGFRTWHTNQFDAPGWRMYLVDVEQDEQSYFRYLHPKTGELVTVWDKKGRVNFFRIDPEVHFWHCIGSLSTNRWSKGFVVPESWRERVGAIAA